MHNTPSLLFITDFYTELQHQNISYCILRKVNEVMQGNAHDIDMTVADNRLSDAEKILAKTANKLNWKLHLQIGNSKDKCNYKSYQYYQLNDYEQKIHIIHIDIIPTFTWQGYELLSNNAMLENIRPNGLFPIASASVEAFCKLFSRLIFNKYVKSEYKRDIQETFQNEGQTILPLLRNFLTPETAQYIYTLACDGQWDDIENERKLIIANIKKIAKRSKFMYYLYILRKAIKRKGLIIVFQGTDGSGKSTIIQGLTSVIGNSYSKSTIDYNHWRPKFLHLEKKCVDAGMKSSTDQPHASPPLGRLTSLAKMVFYTLDYLLGYVGRTYWQAARGHLIIFDRYYYDFYIDKLRYRLSINDAWIRFFQIFIPKPDITFLMVGDAQQIFERKKELPVAEVQRQIDAILKHQKLFTNPHIVDVSMPIPSVLYYVSREILSKLSTRN